MKLVQWECIGRDCPSKNTIHYHTPTTSWAHIWTKHAGQIQQCRVNKLDMCFYISFYHVDHLCGKWDGTWHLAHLDVDAGDVTSAKELNMVFLLVDWVVVDACVLARVPVKHKLTIVQSSDAFLPTNDAEITLLQLPITVQRFRSHHMSHSVWGA